MGNSRTATHPLNPVSYTDLWLLDEINAKMCRERLLPMSPDQTVKGGGWEGVAFACWVKKHVVAKQTMTITLAFDGQRTIAGDVIRVIDL